MSHSEDSRERRVNGVDTENGILISILLEMNDKSKLYKIKFLVYLNINKISSEHI